MSVKGRQYPAEALNQHELTQLTNAPSLRAPTGIRNRALITLLARSGLRISEALALRVSDVNLNTHEIRVLHGKGDKATTRGFHPSATDALIRWIDTRKTLRVNGAPLFCTLDGQPLYSVYVRQMIARMARRANIEKRVTPHTLRHTFAVDLERSGMPVTAISKLLGHSSVSVTSRYLDHLTNSEAITQLTRTELPALPV